MYSIQSLNGKLIKSIPGGKNLESRLSMNNTMNSLYIKESFGNPIRYHSIRLIVDKGCTALALNN